MILPYKLNGYGISIEDKYSNFYEYYTGVAPKVQVDKKTLRIAYYISLN